MRPGVRRAGEPMRWGRCVDHSGESVVAFATQHFGEPGRQILLVGGAGFDPRTLTTARLLARVASGRLRGFFLRERRPDPGPELVSRAEQHLVELREVVPDSEVVDVDVFEADTFEAYAAVGLGRHVVDAVNRLDLSLYTDIVMDLSALSVGSSFPATRLLLIRLEELAVAQEVGVSSPLINLHAFVTASPTTDACIVPQPSSYVGPVHGFQGRFGIDETARAARLWMPQLRFHRRAELERLVDYINPHDTVPVLPFPAHDPRLGDDLVQHYAEEFDGRWDVDARSIVYADERNPLDFYRTVLRIDDRRNPVFASTGGSLLLLSPIGSKVLALGAMMAAMERDLPVVYVEALSYTLSLGGGAPMQYTDDDLMHVWLFGEAYPPLRIGDRGGGSF